MVSTLNATKQQFKKQKGEKEKEMTLLQTKIQEQEQALQHCIETNELMKQEMSDLKHQNQELLNDLKIVDHLSKKIEHNDL